MGAGTRSQIAIQMGYLQSKEALFGNLRPHIEGAVPINLLEVISRLHHVCCFSYHDNDPYLKNDFACVAKQTESASGPSLVSGDDGDGVFVPVCPLSHGAVCDGRGDLCSYFSFEVFCRSAVCRYPLLAKIQPELCLDLGVALLQSGREAQARQLSQPFLRL